MIHNTLKIDFRLVYELYRQNYYIILMQRKLNNLK